ncbi:MAG TPA: PilW family protein [Steroidobacteraceae bacterium]
MTTQIQHATGMSQRGFTLVEMMVAITISVFLAGGLLMMVQSTRNAFGNQQLLAQLQDNQRLVMTFMAEVVESTGYFPDPVHNTNTGVFPLTGTFAASTGQAVWGTHTVGLGGDKIWIRYAAAQNDASIFNCKGLTNTTVAPYDVFVNEFWVNTAVAANPVLTCRVSSTAIPQVDIPLVNGVQNLTILYGIKKNTAADTGSCADTYLNATQMAGPDWSNVCAINVSMSFVNPLNPAGPPIIIQRVIATMNAAGVNS